MAESAGKSTLLDKAALRMLQVDSIMGTEGRVWIDKENSMWDEMTAAQSCQSMYPPNSDMWSCTCHKDKGHEGKHLCGCGFEWE